jgi:hypothetical protein
MVPVIGKIPEVYYLLLRVITAPLTLSAPTSRSRIRPGNKPVSVTRANKPQKPGAVFALQ